MFNIDFLKKLRMRELDLVRCELRPRARILEFGAGTGIQALALQQMGYDVVAIDLASSSYSPDRVFPVINYDGYNLPFDDKAFDIIFSSNVLEHVSDVPYLLSEFKRLLSPGGYCVHLMPSVTWRAWTFISGVPTAAVGSWKMLNELIAPPSIGRGPALRQNLKTIIGGLLPLGHGTSMEGMSELWTFSARAWRGIFSKAGFTVEKVRPIGIFHTGHMLAGARLSLNYREHLSRYLGSAATAFIVRPTPT
ncbi:class I SAM-dependent methyltransferase [Sphingomonas sp. Root710]|uniref:class I SAM-dependent methyltransferase n=1 Tax=Sphingomonas sp. Root710 TaxID=1736594 RepID=UPI0009EC4351|nr:class I SAM-dependent methyltransferase [Sphingomonas sp. Root710]